MSKALNNMRLALREAGSEQDTIARMIHWAELYLRFAETSHPESLDLTSLEHFLADLINERHTPRSGQDQALEAIRLLFAVNCDQVPDWLDQFMDERRKSSAQITLSYAEISRLLTRLYGLDWLAAALIYGSGLRVLECLRLRVRDLDLVNNQVAVRASNDRIERWTPLPANIEPTLHKHLEQMRKQHLQDIVQGKGRVTLPGGMAQTQPRLARSWDWKYVFPQPIEANEPGMENQPVHHIEADIFRRALERAAVDAHIYRQISGATLRNSFAAQMAMRGVSKEQIQQMLGLRKMPGRNGEPEPLAIDGLHLPVRKAAADITYI